MRGCLNFVMIDAVDTFQTLLRVYQTTRRNNQGRLI